MFFKYKKDKIIERLLQCNVDSIEQIKVLLRREKYLENRVDILEKQIKNHISYWYSSFEVDLKEIPGGTVEVEKLLGEEIISHLEKEGKIQYKVEEIPGLPGRFFANVRINNYK